MPFKKNEDGTYAQTDDGLLIYVSPDGGAEKPYDPDARSKQIAELTEKANKRKGELDEANAKLAVFEGIEDLQAFVKKAKDDAAAVAAMAENDKEREIGMQKRIADAVKEALTAAQAKTDALEKDYTSLKANYDASIISNAFMRSKYVAENLVSPALAQELFGKKFQVKDGHIIGMDTNGKEMYGSEGIASFEEALSRMVKESPYREMITRSAPGGSGAVVSEANLSQRGMTAEQAGKLSPEAYAKARKEGKI